MLFLIRIRCIHLYIFLRIVNKSSVWYECPCSTLVGIKNAPHLIVRANGFEFLFGHTCRMRRLNPDKVNFHFSNTFISTKYEWNRKCFNIICLSLKRLVERLYVDTGCFLTIKHPQGTHYAAQALPQKRFWPKFEFETGFEPKLFIKVPRNWHFNVQYARLSAVEVRNGGKRLNQTIRT